MLKLKIIIASTRPGRKGPALAEWLLTIANKHGGFETELLDLAVINLPFMDEAHHPRLKKYEKQHTKDWSAKIDPADAFIIVTPEYNYGMNAPMKNAIDFLSQEWGYKPVAFMSYGGVSAGTRALQMLKQVVTAVNMMPLPLSISVPFFTKFIDESGKFVPEEGLEKSANSILDELEKWAKALKPMRGES